MKAMVWYQKEIKKSISSQDMRSMGDRSHLISRYLKNFIRQKKFTEDFTVLMPSINALTELFECTQREVINGFKTLKDQGYEFIFPGVYGEISMFKRT